MGNVKTIVVCCEAHVGAIRVVDSELGLFRPICTTSSALNHHTSECCFLHSFRGQRAPSVAISFESEPRVYLA
jgi:hypothetical protein